MAQYMMRRRNLTLEEYNAASYPLNRAAAALNFSYHKSRRVINPKRAHMAVLAAGTRLHTRAYTTLAQRYFEGGEDIGRMEPLLAAYGDLGLSTDELEVRRALDRVEGQLIERYRFLDAHVSGVPYFLIRHVPSGLGLDIDGPATVSDFVEAIRRVQAAPLQPRLGTGWGLMQPAGMVMAGFGGRSTLVAAVDRLAGATIIGANLDGWDGPATWPYTAADFRRADEDDDAMEYDAPRFVAHVDEDARRALTATYAAYFQSVTASEPPRHRRPIASKPLALLDMGASWLSHYPPLPNGSRVAVLGMNAEELDANMDATEVAVVNLNAEEARLPYADGSFDVVTSVASVQYMARPLPVFSEMHRVLRPGGVAIVSFSNRCFEAKAVRVWLEHMDEEVALCSVVRNYFYFGPRGGWQNVSSADISPHPSLGDPMWLVTAVKRA